MHIVVLVSNPFLTDARVFNESRALIKAGYDVTVVAWDREKKLEANQVVDGVKVVRLCTPLAPRYGMGKPPWHLMHLLLWQWRAYRGIMALHKRQPVDVLHCHYFHALPVTVALKQKLGIRAIYDARDIYGYLLFAERLKWIAPLFFRLEKFLTRRVDSVIAVNEPARSYFQGITFKPVTIIMNCKDLIGMEYTSSQTGGLFTLIYIGTLHRLRNLDWLLNAVSSLPSVRCIVGGIGQPDYIEELKDRISQTSNVLFMGRVPFSEVLPLTQKSDAVFCMVDPVNINTRITAPNKLFEAMVCGRPLICTRDTYSGDFVEREGIGVAIEFNEQALREAIIELRDNPELCEQMGRNALRAAINKYNWKVEQEKLLGLYRSLAPVCGVTRSE